VVNSSYDVINFSEMFFFTLHFTAIIQSRRLSIFGHIAHMDDDADAKMILTAPHQRTGRDHQGVLVSCG